MRAFNLAEPDKDSFDIVERILESIGVEWLSRSPPDMQAVATADSADFSDAVQRIFFPVSMHRIRHALDEKYIRNKLWDGEFPSPVKILWSNQR